MINYKNLNFLSIISRDPECITIQCLWTHLHAIPSISKLTKQSTKSRCWNVCKDCSFNGLNNNKGASYLPKLLFLL